MHEANATGRSACLEAIGPEERIADRTPPRVAVADLAAGEGEGAADVQVILEDPQRIDRTIGPRCTAGPQAGPAQPVKAGDVVDLERSQRPMNGSAWVPEAVKSPTA